MATLPATASVQPGYGQNGGGGFLPASQTNLQAFGAQGINTNDYVSLANQLNINSDFIQDPTQQIDNLKQNTLSPTNLLPGQRILDPTTQGLINTQLTQAYQDPTSTWMKGVDQSNFLGNPHPLSNSLQTGQDDAFTSALQRNNQNNYNDSLTALKSNLAFQAPQNQMAQMNQASGELAMNEQLKIKNYEQQYQYMLQRQTLDNQAIMAQNAGRSSVLNGVMAGAFAIAAAAL